MQFDDLEFVRIIQPDIIKGIPRYLFEQIDEADPDMIDRIYQFGTLSIANPSALIYALINDQHMIKGVLWATVNVIEGMLWVNIFSVDKEYQGGSIKKATEFLSTLLKDSKIKRIECQTAKPKAYEKTGWKKSKQIHLQFEVSNGKDNQDNKERDNSPDTP